MGKEKSKAKPAPTKPAEPPAKKPAETLEAKILEVMAKLKSNGVVEVSSRTVSDKLGLEPDAGRAKVRQIMKKLEKAGKIEISTKMVGKRKQYVYKCAQ